MDAIEQLKQLKIRERFGSIDKIISDIDSRLNELEAKELQEKASVDIPEFMKGVSNEEN